MDGPFLDGVLHDLLVFVSFFFRDYGVYENKDNTEFVQMK